ncbi:MAG: acyl-CoA dehydrogenase [Candidatus Eisenbacteria bacterium]|nr:acyl-CoA dehydrogenase [Candidatus Eisenbacteria bacterium]
MDFALTQDQKMVREMVREFATKELEPIAAEIDESREFPTATLKKMAGLGLMGVVIPEKYGGAGMDFTTLAIICEEISRVCASHGVITAVTNSLCAYPIYHFGNEEQRKKYLPDLCSGKALGAIGITEANAGSDPAGMETTAVLKGDHYVVNGTKAWITNGQAAGTFIIFAYTDPAQRHKGMSAFIVGKDFQGFSVGKHENLMGIRATGNCELIMDECVVPKENLLGKEGDGFKILMHTLDTSRIDIGAQGVGISQGALDASVKYAKERKQFGQPIGEFEMVQDMIAQMSALTDAARLLTYRAAWMKDSGIERYTREAAIAKYYAAEAVVAVTRMAVQIHGGNGYSKDYPVERMYRDAKIVEIYEGTSQIQKIVIARAALK